MHLQNTYATLDPRLYHKQPPTPLKNPQAGHFNLEVAKQIGWDTDHFLMENWVKILGGEVVPDGFEPLSMVYAGHQFGQWAGQLGDGRGLLLAQVIDNQGNLTDLHLKGAGLTPYSRMGDGRAVVRSVVREYLAGHALNHLGIKSSNALGFVVSDTAVRRESIERGAALLRTTDSHIRFGHFEWIASFAPNLLLEFTQYVVRIYFADSLQTATPITDFLQQVVTRTARLIADWQLVGFAHGVMNTDNLSITGATIDFGPYGFLERFNPIWINNHSDYQGRYVFQNQPAIAQWNLSRLISLFLRLDGQAFGGKYEKETLDKTHLTEILDSFESQFYNFYQTGLCEKFGLAFSADNFNLAVEYLNFLQQNQLDYTNSLRALLAVADNGEYNEKFAHEYSILAILNAEIADNATAQQFLQDWQSRYLALNIDKDKIASHNPIYILRNGMAQAAIEKAEQNDFNEVDRLFKLLQNPYQLSPLALPADTLPPAPDAPEICVSCSS